MSGRVQIFPCETPPPVAHALPGRWWFYQVDTASGRNHCSGYAPGSKADVQRIAAAHLARMESLEGSRTPKGLTVVRPARTARRSTGHDKQCRCRGCSLEREKSRYFTSMHGSGDLKRRARRKVRA